MSAGAARSRPFGLVSGLLVALMGALALWSAVGAALASRMEARAEAGWAELRGSSADLFARYPATETNASALQLERLAARIGISLADFQQDGRARPDRPDRHSPGPLPAAARVVVERNLDDPTARIPTPDPEAFALLEAHRADVTAVVAHILEAPEPTWRDDLEPLATGEFFELIEFHALVDVLLLDALEELRAGEVDRASARLEAVERLADVAMARPGRGGLSSGLQWMQWRAIVARKGALATRPPGPWLEEHAGAGLDERLLDELQARLLAEARLFRFMPSFSPLAKEDTRELHGPREVPVDAIATLLLAPGYRVEGAWVYERGLVEARALRARPACGGLTEPLIEPRGPLPGWIAAMAPGIGPAAVGAPFPGRAVGLADLARLQIELTRKVADLERVHAETGAWPKPTPDRAATFCAEGGWIYEPRADGGMSIAFRRADGGTPERLRYEHPA